MIGSILVTTILKTQDSNRTTSANGSSPFNYAATCGANNCPTYELAKSSTDPSTTSVYELLASLIGLCLLAILITILFMDNLPSTIYTKTMVGGNETRQRAEETSASTTTASDDDADDAKQPRITPKRIRKSSPFRLIILIPLIIYNVLDNSKKVELFKNEIKNLKQMSKSVDLFLLLPITAYSGFELTILWTEFNRVSPITNDSLCSELMLN